MVTVRYGIRVRKPKPIRYEYYSSYGDLIRCESYAVVRVSDRFSIYSPPTPILLCYTFVVVVV